MAAKQLPAVAAMVRKQPHPRRGRGASNSRARPISQVPSRPSGQNHSWGLTRYVWALSLPAKGSNPGPKRPQRQPQRQRLRSLPLWPGAT